MMMSRSFLLSITVLLISSACYDSADGWNPAGDHPCTIETIPVAVLAHRFSNGKIPPLYGSPIVIKRGKSSRNQHFQNITHRETMVSNFPKDFLVTLSSSNSLSEHRRTIPFQEYLAELDSYPITTPDQRSNESWYLFGETYSSEWKELLRWYDLPPCHTCQADLVALAFGIGNRGSGVSWHVHGPGFSETMHGRKHWLLYDPTTPPVPHLKDESTRHWMEFHYENATIKPWECTIQPGDLLYFPDKWYHATINLDFYTAFVSTFTTEHNVDMHEEEL